MKYNLFRMVNIQDWKWRIKGWAWIGVAGVIVACDGMDDQPPASSILAPVTESSVSGIALVQVGATDESEVTRVEVYTREIGTTVKGILIGSTNSRTGTGVGETAPFVISWNTQRIPNLSSLELYAVAFDASENKGISKPVKVSVFNSGAPVLDYFAGFSLPVSPIVPTSLLTEKKIDWEKTLPPTDWNLKSSFREGFLDPQDTSNPKRRYAVEWAWEPYNGARGYNIYLSKDTLLGTYTKQKGQQPDGTNGSQKFSMAIEGSALEETPYFGTVTGLSLSGESPFSNANKGFFLAEQLVTEPIPGSRIGNGRPTLKWAANQSQEVGGYLYFVYKKNPLVSSEAPVWSNPNNRSTSQLTVEYPNSKDPLPTGTYFWWVAGVSFNEEGRPNGFSFSEPKTFEVP